MTLESNKVYSENPPPPPAIRTLIHKIESNLFETIPIGGATWIPATAVEEGGEYISPDYEMNETILYLEAFIDFIRQGKAPEKLTLEGYHASVWSLLAEQAAKSGNETFLPKKYLV